MFKKDVCDLCGDCLVECQWMEVERGQAEEWMKKMIDGKLTPAVNQCITCYACNEICPQDANPFDLIAELQEKYHLLPEETIDSSEQRYLFTGELK